MQRVCCWLWQMRYVWEDWCIIVNVMLVWIRFFSSSSSFESQSNDRSHWKSHCVNKNYIDRFKNQPKSISFWDDAAAAFSWFSLRLRTVSMHNTYQMPTNAQTQTHLHNLHLLLLFFLLLGQFKTNVRTIQTNRTTSIDRERDTLSLLCNHIASTHTTAMLKVYVKIAINNEHLKPLLT